MLSGMKLLASVAALVLTGLVAGWLWLDATADVRGDTAGVSISGPVDLDPAALTAGVLTPAPAEDAAVDAGTAAGASEDAADAAPDGAEVLSVLRASAGELVDRADRTRAAEKQAEEKKAAAARRKAEQQAAEDARGRTEEQKAVVVQPAPVNPGGWCEWDDDGWECDDYDDGDDD